MHPCTLSVKIQKEVVQKDLTNVLFCTKLKFSGSPTTVGFISIYSITQSENDLYFQVRIN